MFKHQTRDCSLVMFYVMTTLMLVSCPDQTSIWQQHAAGVQSTGNEAVKVHPAALWDIQDRLGLVDLTLHLLHCHHCAVQRCLLYRRWHGTAVDHCDGRYRRNALYYRWVNG